MSEIEPIYRIKTDRERLLEAELGRIISMARHYDNGGIPTLLAAAIFLAEQKMKEVQ